MIIILTMAEVIDTLNMVHRMFTPLKEGGLSSDRDGQVKATGLNRLVKSLKRKITSLETTLKYDLSEKVFTE